MHTSLSLLKENQACVPGYTRMLSFFGTDLKLKNQEFPLHAIALIGGKEDLTWAVESRAFKTNKEQFDAFFLRNARKLFHVLLSQSLTSKNKSRWYELAKLDGADLFRFFESAKYDTYLSNQFESMWALPHIFVERCLANSEYRIPRNSAVFQGAHNLPLNLKDAPSVNMEEEEDDSDEYEEEGEPETRYEDEEEVVIKKKERLPSYSPFGHDDKKSPGQNAAHLFTDTPYAFLNTIKFKMPRNVQTVDGNFEITFNTNKEYFNFLKMFANSSIDKDQI